MIDDDSSARVARARAVGSAGVGPTASVEATRRRSARRGWTAALLLCTVSALASGTGTAYAAPGTARSHTTTTSTTLPPPVAGFLRGHVTAIGDSVMVDYEANLVRDLPGVAVDASVSRQWSEGVALVRRLRASHRLGATVVIGLGTNGPVQPADLAQMTSALKGASRIVLVTVVVDRPWQGPNNRLYRAAAARKSSRIVVADWADLGGPHRSWFYADGTHLPIGGVGAQALAALVAKVVRHG